MQQAPVKNNPLTFYLRMILYMILAIFIRIVAFAPLCALFVFPAESALRWLAVLCPLLLIFLVLPLRYSFAEALVQKPRRRRFSLDTALSLSNYGEKLAESLLHALNVLKWGIPLFAMLGYGYYIHTNIDVLTELTMVSNIGKGVTDFYCGIANFFITLFGSVHTLTSTGDLMEGLLVLLGVLGVGVLIWLIGAMRNSATRYIWVIASRDERSPRTETRRRLRGRRFHQFLTAMINLVLWMPALIVLFSVIKDVIGSASTMMMMMLSSSKTMNVNAMDVVGPLLFVFVCLYMPLLPVRRWVTASFATRNVRHTASKKPVQSVANDSAAHPAVENGGQSQAAPQPIVFAPEQAATPAPVAPFAPVQSADSPVSLQSEPMPQTGERDAVAYTETPESEASLNAEPDQDVADYDAVTAKKEDPADAENTSSDASSFTLGQ